MYGAEDDQKVKEKNYSIEQSKRKKENKLIEKNPLRNSDSLELFIMNNSCDPRITYYEQ
jgi:hypothetical protein